MSWFEFPVAFLIKRGFSAYFLWLGSVPLYFSFGSQTVIRVPDIFSVGYVDDVLGNALDQICSRQRTMMIRLT